MSSCQVGRGCSYIGSLLPTLSTLVDDGFDFQCSWPRQMQMPSSLWAAVPVLVMGPNLVLDQGVGTNSGSADRGFAAELMRTADGCGEGWSRYVQTSTFPCFLLYPGLSFKSNCLTTRRTHCPFLTEPFTTLQSTLKKALITVRTVRTTSAMPTQQDEPLTLNANGD